MNNRSLSYVANGNLHLYPRLTANYYGMDITQPGFDINLWGSCTSNAFNGCQKQTVYAGAGKLNIVNPISSARVSTVDSFSFKYGRVEIRAKLPKGDWLWPALWLLPKSEVYGGWPASGEMYGFVLFCLH